MTIPRGEIAARALDLTWQPEWWICRHVETAKAACFLSLSTPGADYSLVLLLLRCSVKLKLFELPQCLISRHQVKRSLAWRPSYFEL